MFDLIINDQSVYLPEDFSFSLVRENPLFNERGDFSYPFTIPYQPNKAIFNYAAEIDSVIERGVSLPFRLEWNGNIELQGEIPSWKVMGSDIEFNLTGGKTLFFSKLKGKYMDKTSFGDVPTDEDERYNDSLLLTAKDINYVFAPVYMPSFWGSERLEYALSDIVNKWNPITNKLHENVDGKSNVLAMHLYLQFVLRKIINKTGYTVGRNDLDDYDDFDRAYIVSMNRTAAFSSATRYQDSLPHILITDFLDTLNDWINLKLVPNDKTRTVDLVLLSKVIADTNVNTDHNNKVLINDPETESSEELAFKLSYKLEADSYKNLDEEVTETYYLSVATYNDLPTPEAAMVNSIRKVIATDRHFICTLYAATEEGEADVYKWELYGDLSAYSELVEEDELEDIEVDIEPIPPKLVDVDYDDNGIVGTFETEIPWTSRQGNVLTLSKREYTDFPIMLCFYRGLFTYTTFNEDSQVNVTVKHPMSTFDCFQIDEIPRGDLSMKWNSDKGIKKLFHENVLHWMKYKKRPFEQYFDLSPADLFSLQWVQKYQFGDYTFLIDKINVEMERDRIAEIRIELYTV